MGHNNTGVCVTTTIHFPFYYSQINGALSLSNTIIQPMMDDDGRAIDWSLLLISSTNHRVKEKVNGKITLEITLWRFVEKNNNTTMISLE